MATTKLTTDVEQYLKWAGADGTTQQQYQEFVRNMYSTLSDVVKITMWQPNTSYPAGAVLVSPDMPVNTLARVAVAGTTGTVIPTWGAAGSTVVDGTVKWTMLYRTMDDATTKKSGYMSARDKAKLDRIAEDATNVTDYVQSVTESNGKVTVTKGSGESTTFNAGLNILARNKAYAVGDIAYSPNLPSYLYLECTTAGTTGATEPDMSTLSGVVNDGTAQFGVKTVCAKEYVDISVSKDAEKWKAAYNNLRKRSTPTAFDDDELTVLIDTITDPKNGVTLPQPYTNFDGLLIEYTGNNKTIVYRAYISTEEINKMVESILSHPNKQPEAFFVIDGTYYWSVKAVSSYKFSPTFFPNNDNNLYIWKIYGVKFKEIT